MIPCISTKSVNYLYGTADERYSYSKDFFRKTHFPQTLNRYYRNKLTESVSENDLLEEIEEHHTFGNRIFVIFGSTGSGKSELLCWIRDQWSLSNNPRPIIRISRNELNPQVLVKKCYESIGLELGDLIIDEYKWDLLLSKPITIINQMVWSTMSELFESDDDIVPATLLLRPVIEKNILEFTKQILKGKISKPLEIITKEEFELLLNSTTIKIDIHYNKFRDSLLKKLDQYLFQGTDMKTIFKQLTKLLLELKIRPVLLIDDLVQSINLYAADLLDYFLTLEEGNWDVVIGLTPGVEQGEDFTLELKNRIKNLDTIDDRVKKLWLSDESGSNFFTLEKKQAQQYLLNYILALKEANGYTCTGKCPHANSCKRLFIDSDTDLNILPFNIPLINRIFDGIPNGKGTLRYLILHSREILQFLIKGESKAAKKIINLLNREVFVEHEDKTIKLLSEMYSSPNDKEYTIAYSFLKHFKFDCPDITVSVRKLGSYNKEEINEDISEARNVVNPHIRDWIEGHKVKDQLLEPLRSGVATIIHEIVKGSSIVRENTSRAIKSSAVIQRCEIVNRYKYPISFKENNKMQIVIDKNINLLQISNFQQLKMQDRGDMFAKISNDINVSEWIFQTERLKRQWVSELEKYLGYPIEDFAYYFKNLMSKIHRIGQSDWTSSIVNPIQKEWLEIAEEFFLDWFALRDNIVDYNKIDNMIEDKNFDQKFLSFTPSKALNKFQIKNYPLGNFIVDLQKAVKNYLDSIKPLVIDKANEIISLKRFTRLIPGDLVQKIEPINNILQKENLILDDIKYIDDIVNFLSKEENRNVITQFQNEQSYLNNINKFFPLIEDDEVVRMDIVNLTKMDEYLRDKLKLRGQVRKYIIKLLENGETQLPRKQWKGILRDIEAVNPEFFDHIHLNVYIRK
ncbi:hypothetical protein [Neobacillus sp.]|uniref:hypothetical protein n=1 Tax=Neobacillus sp. TaxID=2675273 RepID=UPI00289C2430|nr:hypothetical protein [Neobacillus sp.]